MASFYTKAFTVSQLESTECLSRAVRRVHIGAEALKVARICAGDAVAIVDVTEVSEPDRPFAVGVAWPSLDLPPEAVATSASLLRTAGIEPGAKVHVVPLVGKPPAGLPSLRQAREAAVVHLQEVNPSGGPMKDAYATPDLANRSTRFRMDEGKKRNWLTLLLRELLVDLRYLVATQVLTAVYEGTVRSFVVTSISTPAELDERYLGSSVDLTADMKRLSLHLSGDGFGPDGILPQLSAQLQSADLTNRRGRKLSTLSMDARGATARLWTVGWDTLVIVDPPGKGHGAAVSRNASVTTQTTMDSIQSTSTVNAYNRVGGLDPQIAQIRDLLEIPLTRPELFRHFGLKPPRGVLLHGAPGTGKTHLARAIAASTKSAVVIVNGPELSSAYHGETEAKLRGLFEEAQAKSPCVVVLDEIDALCPRREGGDGGEVEKRVVATLLTIMDGFEEDDAYGRGRVVVVATTNRPDAIDPALRRPGRFDREIEIGIPDATARLSILNVLLSRTPHDISQSDLRSVAARAHGYVGADLDAVVREAGTRAIKRWLSSQSSFGPADSNPTGSRETLLPPTPEPIPSTTTPGSIATSAETVEDGVGRLAFAREVAAKSPPSVPALALTDLLLALPTVRPSALRSVYLPSTETPVRYADIGGLDSVVQRLRECVEWPLQHPEAFVRLGVRAPRGVLLYGPPGCSKTMLVRALASESGVNFVSVKGPELLSKYVGESERAVRELFKKARGAAPCILFFDEVDALASSRGSNTTAASDGVLTSMLTEMDGVQEMGLGVTVVAATNRPEALDSALMRPGRIDRLIYVGPPDREGREEILKIRMRTMRVGPDVPGRMMELSEATDGCSGAEIVALCQEAALRTMKNDIQAPFVPCEEFLAAARASRRHITPEIVERYKRWGSTSEY